jgi:3-phenylpropionate/trans-cinnamate dioxygenase ferredoxin subunit
MINIEKICRIEDIPRGMIRRFKSGDKDILIAHTTDGYYAMDSICSHKKADLSKGRLEYKSLHCPVHGTIFDLTTGKVLKNVSRVTEKVTGSTATKLRTYPVRVDAGNILVEI